MTEPFRRSRRQSEVTDQRQARLLTDPRSAALIYPFLGRERATAEAATDAHCAITTIAYRVRVLRDAGLLEVTRTSRRAGRPITYYRSNQDAYHVPLAATGFTDHRDQARRIGAPIYRRITDAYSDALARSGTATRFITRDNGSIYSTDLPPHRTRSNQPLLFEDRNIQLTTKQAEWLCTEFDRIITRLTEDNSGDPGARDTYLVMVAAVPTQN